MRTALTILLAGIVLSLCSSGVLAETFVKSTPDVTVIVGKDAPYVERHAAEEFIKYATTLTGTAPVLLADDEPLVAFSKRVVVVGTPETNTLIKMLAEKGLVDFSGITWDGFIAKSVVDGDTSYLVLGGGMGRGTLYAVYDYLQRFCHVGFFLDGERIPTGGALVWDGVNVASNPFFKFRKQQRFGYGHLMVRKYTCHWWKWADFKYNMDWWAKLKFNEGDVVMGENSPGGIFLDESIREVFADAIKPDDFAEGGSAGLDIWPPQYRLHLEDKAYQYATKLALYAEPYVIAQIPRWFREKHPEIDFDNNDIRTRFARTFMGKCMKRYPALHHIYGGWEFWKPERADRVGEWIGDMDALAEVFVHMIDMLREFDPEAIYRSDWGWNLHYALTMWNESPWSIESTRQLYDMSPPDSLFLDDYACDKMLVPPYLHYDYYLGQMWSFGTFWNGWVDALTGDFADTLAKAQEVARNPKGRNCVGVRLHQENQGTNAMYRQFVMTLGWNPLGVTLDGFLGDFALQRYGPASQAQMVKSLEVQVEASALNTTFGQPGYSGGFTPLYRNWWPNVALLSITNDRYAGLGREMQACQKFREALRLALVEKERQASNDLYNRDVVDQARMALGALFDFYFIQGTVEWQLGNADASEAAFDQAFVCLDQIEKILSTRPDFSMQETIDHALSVPGLTEQPRVEWGGAKITKFETPEAMVKGASFQYGNCDCFEQTYHYYRPVVRAQIARLKGEDVSYADDLWPNWVNGPTEVPEDHHFKGTTIEAVSQAYGFLDAVDDAAIEDYVAELPAKLARVWSDDLTAESTPMPQESGPAVVLSDDFSGSALDATKWNGEAILTDGRAALLETISFDFDSEDWSLAFAANYTSAMYSSPNVRLMSRVSRSAVKLFCSDGTIYVIFDGERKGMRVSRQEAIGKADGKFHVFRASKKGSTVSVSIDGTEKATFELPPDSDQWRLACGGHNMALLFLDWVTLAAQ